MKEVIYLCPYKNISGDEKRAYCIRKQFNVNVIFAYVRYNAINGIYYGYCRDEATDRKIPWLRTKSASLNECKTQIDCILVKNGYIFLSEERLNKLELIK